MIKDIRHTGIVVDDLEVSLAFYCGLLGLVVARRMEESGFFLDTLLALQNAQVTTVKMTTPGGQLIELLSFHSHPPNQKTQTLVGRGPTHIAFTVDDLDQEYQRLKETGISFTSPPQVSPDGFAKVAFCQAPEGTFIELVEEL